MNLGDHENDGDEEKKEGWQTKELENVSDILIFVFGLNIYTECPIHRQQKSRTERHRIKPGMM